LRSNPIADHLLAAANQLTNALSTKFESHIHMVVLYMAWYNDAKRNKSLRAAMATGIVKRFGA
jgi:hypothetical protein